MLLQSKITNGLIPRKKLMLKKLGQYLFLVCPNFYRLNFTFKPYLASAQKNLDFQVSDKKTPKTRLAKF